LAEYGDVEPDRCEHEVITLLEELMGVGLVEIVVAANA
jgi:hypothetical protein